MRCVNSALDHTKAIRIELYKDLLYHDVGANDPPVYVQPYRGTQCLVQAKDSDSVS
jgi:hypothetical protein